MQNQPKIILSNVEGLARAGGGRPIVFVEASPHWRKFTQQCATADLVIIDNDQRTLFLASVMRLFCSFKLVSVDLILRPPPGLVGKFIAFAKRILLCGVNCFILYFKNTRGYEKHYGIPRSKIRYVPFKVNGRDQSCWPSATSREDYVLCAGRTLRDVATFVDAMRIAGCPGLLVQQPEEDIVLHGTAAFRGDLPQNVRLVIHEDGELGTFLEFLAGARLVVIPRFRGDIGCTGISTYLMAMGLGKCVILSRGPGAEDLLTREAVLVTPEDVTELASAISKFWQDHEERRLVAAAGQRYAETCGSSDRLLRDILDASLACLEIHPKPQSLLERA